MSSPPQVLGQYQIIREIARSNDIVYEAYDPLMNRRVAIKELSMPAGSTPQQLEDRISRFRREAQAVGKLNHPNIMTVHSFSEDNGKYFMAMEYLDGITLRKEIDNHGFLSSERAIEIARAVLAGLTHAHAEGVVHRDIKPDNIQLTSGGGVKITDFGIARLTFQPNLTMDGQVFGTPSYMSPEQVVGKDIDQRTDLFSVGVMLYEMMTGNKPFQGDNVIAITHAIVNASIPPTNSIPYSVFEVVKRSLEKTPALRYSSAEEMNNALRVADGPAQPNQNTVVGFDPYAAPPPSLVQNPYQQPYGQPPAYQQPYQQPYGQPPYQQPYGGQNLTPYGGAVPSAFNPYGAPPVISTPPSYGAYDPYQPPMAGQMPNQQPYNVFYPPPPGMPLMSADTKDRLRQVVVTTLVCVGLVAVVIVAFIVLTNKLQETNVGSRSQAIPKAAGAGKAPTQEANSTETGTRPKTVIEETPASNAPVPSGPSPDDLVAEGENASTMLTRIDRFIQAGKRYQELGQNQKAYEIYYRAFRIQEEIGDPRSVLRRTAYMMIEVAEPGSEQRAFAENLKNQLSE